MSDPIEKRGMKVKSQKVKGTIQDGHPTKIEIASPQVQNNVPDGKKPKKEKKKSSKLKKAIKILLLLIVFGLVGIVGYKYFIVGNQKLELAYESTGRYALDNYLANVQGYNSDSLKNISDSSYLSQEWSYANNDKLRQTFIESMCAYVKFTYPQVQSTTKNGKLMVDDSGNKVLQESDMLNNEDISVTVVDYKKLSATMEEDKDIILKMYQDSGYKPSDYTYSYEMTNLMLNYILSKSKLPTTEVDVSIPLSTASQIVTNNDGTTSSKDVLVVADDSALDSAVFASDDFHAMCDTFSKVATGFVETSLDTSTSSYIKESVIPYTWIGAYFCQKEYTGTSNKETGGIEAQVGDGTFDYPAGVGTSIVTKAIDVNGVAHDVKVTLNKYYVAKDAIDFAIGFSEKNRGFDSSSVVTLICFDVQVQNLESSPITIRSDMCLTDAQANQSARTGSMYGFTDTLTIQPGEVGSFQDWATSTEINDKYVVWGKSFNRQFNVVWFKLLAGDSTGSSRVKVSSESSTQ